MKLKVSVLASGSSGNSIFISNGKIRLLIDAGLSGKKITDRLKSCNINGEDIDAILVTHEHQDHVKGVGILSRRYDLPIYANELTWEGAFSCLGKIEDNNIKIFNKDFMVGSLGIEPFSISHDARDPVGYIIHAGDKKIGIATDMGYVSKAIKEKLTGLDFLIIESNHDLEMLMAGSYPPYLKKRIRSKHGHLSNDATAALLPEIVNSNYPSILLAHLSKDNNIPDLAYITIKNNLEDKGLIIGEDLELDFTYRDRPTSIYEVG